MAQLSGSRTWRVLWPPESLERAGRCAPQVHLPRARCQGAVVRSLARPWRTARSGRRSRGRGGAARMAAADDGPPGAARRSLGTRRPSGVQSGRPRLFAQLPGVMVGRTSLPKSHGSQPPLNVIRPAQPPPSYRASRSLSAKKSTFRCCYVAVCPGCALGSTLLTWENWGLLCRAMRAVGGLGGSPNQMVNFEPIGGHLSSEWFPRLPGTAPLTEAALARSHPFLRRGSVRDRRSSHEPSSR